MAEDIRIEAYVTKMEELGLDCIVAYFDGIHTFLMPNFVYLLSGFKAIGESIVVLYRSGTSALITTPSWDVSRLEQRAAFVSHIATDELLPAFKNLMSNRTMSADKIGFIGCNNLNQAAYTEIRSYFEYDLNCVDHHFLEISSSKSEQELEKANKATWIAERGYEKMLEVARPGIYEYQLAGEVVSFMQSLGADDNFMLMSASQHNYAVRPPGRRRLEKGDIILAEISPSFQGQFTQICRTVVLGNANTGRLIEKYDLLIEALERGISSAKPGESLSNVVREINQPLEEAGYGKYCHPPYMRVRGHGLGISSILPGDVSVDNPIILQEGMFFVIHPNQYIPETGYLLCGEPVIINGSGAKSIAKRRPGLDIISV